jgi:hypothetical protein
VIRCLPNPPLTEDAPKVLAMSFEGLMNDKNLHDTFRQMTSENGKVFPI